MSLTSRTTPLIALQFAWTEEQWKQESHHESDVGWTQISFKTLAGQCCAHHLESGLVVKRASQMRLLRKSINEIEHQQKAAHWILHTYQFIAVWATRAALFPGPTQLFVVCSMEKQGEPGIFLTLGWRTRQMDKKIENIKAKFHVLFNKLQV